MGWGLGGETGLTRKRSFIFSFADWTPGAAAGVEDWLLLLLVVVDLERFRLRSKARSISSCRESVFFRFFETIPVDFFFPGEEDDIVSCPLLPVEGISFGSGVSGGGGGRVCWCEPLSPRQAGRPSPCIPSFVPSFITTVVAGLPSSLLPNSSSLGISLGDERPVSPSDPALHFCTAKLSPLPLPPVSNSFPNAHVHPLPD